MNKNLSSLVIAALFAGAAFSSASCSSSRKAKRNVVLTDTVSISSAGNPITIYREAAPKLWHIKHTRVALSFDYAARTAEGSEWITLSPYARATDSLVLDAKSMRIKKVTESGAAKALRFEYDSTFLRIHLNKTLQVNEEITLNIEYTAMPYASESRGSSAITDDKGLYFINTDNKVSGKPVQIWTQGETEANSKWMPTIDKPNMRSTFQIELTVPDQYTTLSNGALVSTVAHGKQRTDIWRIDQPIQIYAAMFAIGNFSVVKDKSDLTEVKYYVEPAYEKHAAMMFANTPEMIAFFSNVTGVKYPWNKYSQIVVRDYVSGAMENTTATLFGAFMNQNDVEYADGNHEDVVSHELFHQWFGDYATAESWSNLTVNESFATYGEVLWRKHKYGAAYADRLAYEDLTRYLDASTLNDPALVRFHYNDKEDMFDRVSYQKGGAILRYWHGLLGDSVFYRAMRTYLNKNALQSAEAEQWRLAVEEADGRDWRWFFDQWYLRGAHPELRVAYAFDDDAKKVRVTVSQTQEAPVYRLPLTIALISGGARTDRPIELNARTQLFLFDYPQGVRPIPVFDAEHLLPAKINEELSLVLLRDRFTATDDYISKIKALEMVDDKNIKSPEMQTMLAAALQAKYAGIQEKALVLLSSLQDERLQEKFISDLKFLAAEASNNKVRAAAIGVLGAWKRKELRSMFADATQERSYLISGAGLAALRQINDTGAARIAHTLLPKTKPNSALDREIWSTLASDAKAEDADLFVRYAAMENDSEVRPFLTLSLLEYVSKVKEASAQQTALTALEREIAETDEEAYRLFYAERLAAWKQALGSKKQSHTTVAMLQSSVRRLQEQEKSEDVRKVYARILK